MLFAICADRGAPGSTTTALALAAARGLPAVVVEADPYGGDLALRLRLEGKRPLPTTPTVLSVAAGRSAQQAEPGPIGMPNRGEPNRRHRDLWRDGAHQLTDLVRVVPGFMTAEHGTSMAWPVLASALESQTVPIFADLGRIHTGSPSMPIATAADALIIVCRGDIASAQHMVERLEVLVPAIAERNGRPPVVMPVVVVARRQHGAKSANRVAELLGETAVGPALRGVSWLAWDTAAVNLLENGADPWAKPLKKSPLMRSAQKAMWMLGLATGLEHAVPVAGKRGARRSDDQTPDRSENGAVWSGRKSEPSPPAQQAVPDLPANPELAGAPRPTWTPRGAGERPRNGTPLAGRLNADAEQQATPNTRNDADAAPHWETAAREERH